LDDGEHRDLKEILSKVMIKGGINASKSPDRRVSDSNAMQKSQNVYDAILARSKRSRMERQPNGYASVQMPVNDYNQE
jgi:hypothetical protein